MGSTKWGALLPYWVHYSHTAISPLVNYSTPYFVYSHFLTGSSLSLRLFPSLSLLTMCKDRGATPTCAGLVKTGYLFPFFCLRLSDPFPITLICLFCSPFRYRKKWNIKTISVVRVVKRVRFEFNALYEQIVM